MMKLDHMAGQPASNQARWARALHNCDRILRPLGLETSCNASSESSPRRWRLKVMMSRFTHGPPNGFGRSSGTKALKWAGYVDAPPPMVVPVLMLK
jgi:hypothetical protein